jgi:hypothetical protein
MVRQVLLEGKEYRVFQALQGLLVYQEHKELKGLQGLQVLQALQEPVAVADSLVSVVEKSHSELVMTVSM